VGVTGDDFRLDGYSAFEASESQAFSPGAVLVAGLKQGVVLGNQRFNYGAIVVVEGTKNQPIFRLARPSDRITLKADRTILGQKYSKGPFAAPEGGTLPTTETQLP